MSSNLRDNAELKSRITAAVHKRSFVTGLEGLSSIHQLNAVFAHLDPLRDILAETLDGWRPPQLVVIGPESSGKSSLLERLVMMPIFPTAEGICTRLPIHVRLRNAAQAQAPRLEVYSLVNNRTEEGPFEVPMQSGALDVRDKMREVLEREHGRVEGVSADRIIILHVHGPHVPSLDVVDMPGLIAAPAGLREQTRALIERQVERHGAYSMYLAVVPAGQRPNTSIAMEVVQGKGLEGRTLGVFTKCDELVVQGRAKVKRLLRNDPNAELGGVALAPHG
jgi:GTP-binding protein EngB required for normal cell division